MGGEEGRGGKEEETVQGNFLWLTSQMTWPEDKQEIKAQANGRNCSCLTGRLHGCGGRSLPESKAGRAALTQRRLGKGCLSLTPRGQLPRDEAASQ